MSLRLHDRLLSLLVCCTPIVMCPCSWAASVILSLDSPRIGYQSFSYPFSPIFSQKEEDFRLFSVAIPSLLPTFYLRSQKYSEISLLYRRYWVSDGPAKHDACHLLIPEPYGQSPWALASFLLC